MKTKKLKNNRPGDPIYTWNAKREADPEPEPEADANPFPPTASKREAEPFHIRSVI